MVFMNEGMGHIWSFPSQRRRNGDRVNPGLLFPQPSVFLIPSCSFLSTLQIRGTGPGGQLQDLDCSSSDDEVAAQTTTKPR